MSIFLDVELPKIKSFKEDNVSDFGFGSVISDLSNTKRKKDSINSREHKDRISASRDMDLSENQAVDLCARVIASDPEFFLKKLKLGLNGVIPEMDRVSREKFKINADFKSLYKRSKGGKKLLKSFIDMVGSGVVYLYGTKGITASKTSNKHQIMLISKRDLDRGDWREVSKDSGLFNGKPAITSFRVGAINSLEGHIYTSGVRASNGGLFSTLLSFAKNSKFSDVESDTDLTDATDYSLEGFSDGDIAMGVVDGSIEESKLKSLDSERSKRVMSLVNRLRSSLKRF